MKKYKLRVRDGVVAPLYERTVEYAFRAHGEREAVAIADVVRKANGLMGKPYTLEEFVEVGARSGENGVLIERGDG